MKVMLNHGYDVGLRENIHRLAMAKNWEFVGMEL